MADPKDIEVPHPEEGYPQYVCNTCGKEFMPVDPDRKDVCSLCLVFEWHLEEKAKEKEKWEGAAPPPRPGDASDSQKSMGDK